MVIRRSSTGEVQRLVADVLSEGAGADGRREAAVARLRVIGDRAVRQVLGALDAAPPAFAQVALLHVLEGRDETAVSAAAVRALASPHPEVRTAAVLLARGLLDEAGGNDLLDRLAALAVDRGEAVEVRLAATAALTALPGRAARPVLERLAADPDPAVRLAASPRAGGGDEPGAEIEDAAAGQLPADPRRLLDALARDGAVVPLPTLHRLVAVVRAREDSERRPANRRDWLTVRGAVHRALAARGSRVALYDVRETLERQGGQPLPDGFAETLGAIGDGTCLEAIAAGCAAAADDAAWRGALVAAAAAIAARERLTKRSAVVKRVKAKWGDAFVADVFGK